MEKIGAIAEIYASAAGQIAQMWVLFTLFPTKKGIKRWHIILWFIICFCFAHFILFPNLVQSVIEMGIMFILSWILLEGRAEKKFLVVIICNVFMILVSIIRGRITVFLSGESIKSISTQGIDMEARIIGIILTNSLYLLTAYIFTRFFHETIKLKKEEYVLVIIFYSLFFVIVLLSIAMSGNMEFPDVWQKTFFVLDILMFFANIIVLKIILYINKQNSYEIENALLRMQLSQQEQRIKEEEKSYQDIKLLRHDMKRYFVTYRQLLEDGRYEMVENDIDKILGERLKMTHYDYTENTILNVVICDKVQQCAEKNIKIDVQINAGKSTESIEYGVMLSNLLDNAIEAEEREEKENRYINLKIAMEQEMIHLMLANYISNSVLQKNASLHTLKEDKRLHGIGLRGVKEFVRQKDGVIEIFEENNMFVVHVSLHI